MTRKDEWQTIGGRTIRTLLDVQLLDVSPVTFPAYPDTDVGVRSLEEIAAEGRTRIVVPPTGPKIAQLRRRLDLAAL
jgi:phage head maturation protease